jgi:hypothetical protein
VSGPLDVLAGANNQADECACRLGVLAGAAGVITSPSGTCLRGARPPNIAATSPQPEPRHPTSPL